MPWFNFKVKGSRLWILQHLKDAIVERIYVLFDFFVIIEEGPNYVTDILERKFVKELNSFYWNMTN